MAIIAKANKKEFTPAPEGLHQAVCVDVIDLGLVDGKWGPKPLVEIRWQINEINDEIDRRFLVTKRYTLSLSEKANLYKDLVAWRGRKFTQEELEGFDLERLIGANCQLQISHNIADDNRVWANIQAVVRVGKDMPTMEPEDYVRVQDRDNGSEPQGDESGGDPEEDLPF